MKPVLAWLRDDKNRDIVRMLAAGLAALVAAGWAVLTFVGDHHSSANITAESGGLAAGHDISGNAITLSPPAAGPSAPATTPAAKSP